MPALPSFITYKPGRRAKAAIKALRGESSHSPSPRTPQPHLKNLGFSEEVIDIKDERYSLDFDGGRPNSDENDILDEVFHHRQQQQTRLSHASSSTSPPVKLEIDLPPEALSDWFAANFPRSENRMEVEEGGEGGEGVVSSSTRNGGMRGMMLWDSSGFLPSGEKVGLLLGEDEDEDEDLAKTSEEIIADLELMDASHFVSEFHSKHSDSRHSKKPSPTPLSIPNNNDLSRTTTDLGQQQQQQQRKKPRDSITMLTSSLSFVDTPASSALSGTTLARALFSNAFSLSSERLLSGGQRSAGPGLTRSDSTVLPRDDDVLLYQDQFSIASDAPPMPADAETLYEAPKKPRGVAAAAAAAERRKQQLLKRRSSTGTLHIKTTTTTTEGTTTSTRPNSLVVSPSSEFDILRSPDPWTADAIPSHHVFPTPKLSATTATPVESLEAQNISGHTLPATPETLGLPDFRFPSPQSPPIGSPLEDPAAAEQRGIDDVLGYYSLPPVPLLAGASYRPAVSPIREETSADLFTRPSPYKHDSKRIPPFGARSQISGSFRARSESLQLPRGPLDTQLISRQNLSPFTEGLPMNEATRSGSPASTPESMRAAVGQQPHTVSPLSSADNSSTDGSLASHRRHDSCWEKNPDYFSLPPTTENLFQRDVSSVPTTPGGGGGGGGGAAAQIQGNGQQPNVAQQLMQRAVSNNRYTRQPAGTGMRPGAPASAVRRIADIQEDVDTPIPHRRVSTDDLNSSHYGPDDEQDTADDDISQPDSRATQSDNGSMYLSNDSSRTKLLKALPPIPATPNHLYVPVTPLQIPSSIRQSSAVLPSSVVVDNELISSSAPTTTSSPPSPPPSPLRNSNPTPVFGRAGTPPTPMAMIRSNSAGSTTTANEIHDRGEGTITDDVDPAAHPGISTSQHQPPSPTSFYKSNYANRSSDLFRGPPPPYYTVFNETPMQDLQTPIATYPDQPSNPGPSNTTVNHRTSDSISREGSRARRRPPLPLGPRRPQALPAQNFPISRDRSGSISTMQPSPRGSSIHRAVSVSMSSPKFQIPPPKWRGYTMEAAVWTFTSAQMQAIVSRAIRQSAEASAIRLLGLDVLDNEIPDEIRRLEAQRTDLKTRYKVLTRRRTVLFEALSSYLMGNAEEEASYSHLEDLAEIALTLDRLSEELHSLDGQLAHLDSLTHVHTGSALAVALRKLNASFLKQMTENQTLRSQLRSAEAERDEAWRQADWVARELDEIHQQHLETTPSPSTTTTNCSRISAHRKSIARSFSKTTGLTTPLQSYNSQRSSMNTATMNSTLSSANTTTSSSLTERVSSIPTTTFKRSRKNLDITIKSPVFNSAMSSANSNFDSPSSASRALNEAQDELYAMLGLSIPERHLRRSRSWNDISISSPPVTTSRHTAQTFLKSTVEAPHARGSRASRRSSLPSDSTLAQVSTAMAADRNAILLTLDLLSATDETFA